MVYKHQEGQQLLLVSFYGVTIMKSPATRQRNLRIRRLATGICVACGELPIVKKSRCQSCLDKARLINQRIRTQRIDNGLCRICGNAAFSPGYTSCHSCRIKHHEWWIGSQHRRRQIELAKVKRKTRRKKVIDAYGGRCACCGESMLTFLAIDHINNDGHWHRMSHKTRSGTTFAKWISKNSFPPGFQVLCHNCNTSKAILRGVCEHHHRPISPPATTEFPCFISGV